MAALATTTDVESMFRALTAEEAVVVPSWLTYLSAQVRLQAPNVDDRMATDTDYADLVRLTVAAAAVRVLRNPDGWRQWSIDDANFTRDQVVSAGLLYLTEGELVQIRGNQGLPSAYVVSLGG